MDTHTDNKHMLQIWNEEKKRTTTKKKTDLVKTLYYSVSPKSLFSAVGGCSNEASISSNSSGKHSAFPELVSQ